MKIQKFIKRCDDFVLCGAYGEGDTDGAVFTDGYPENYAIYHIIVQGTVKMARPFESEYITLDEKTNNFVDVKDYLYSQRIYSSPKPYYMFGFNTIDPKMKWDGRLIKNSFRGSGQDYLICFDGSPIINGVNVRRLDYARLKEKDYDVQLNGAIVGVFTRL